MLLRQFLPIIFSLIGIGCTIYPIFAQPSNIGTPPITNFLKKDYDADTQNWDIAQSKEGLMYFANNGGLLEFDGVRWQCYGVSNQTAVRSLRIAEDGRIYVGAQGELGYFKPHENGELHYHSLTYLLPEEGQNFADVWDIEILGHRVFFRTGFHVFVFEDEKLSIIYTQNNLMFAKVIGNEFFLQDEEKGLLRLENDTFKPVLSENILTYTNISGIFNYHLDTFLITTLKNGLFLLHEGGLEPWEVKDNNKMLSSSNIYTSTQINDHLFALGTSENGVFIINKKGQIVRHVHRGLKLQDNNVLSLFCDYANNLWVGLNNGIDYIETSSPFTYIYSDENLQGTGYGIQIFNDEIYLGTSNGVYKNAWKSHYHPTEAQSFKFVKNTNGQVWNLLQFNDELLLNHHAGTFVIKNNTVTKVSKMGGSWMQLPLSNQKKYLLSGYYNGLSLFEWQNGWREIQNFENDWKESCRIMAQDEDGNIWVSHPYRGVFKVHFNANYTKLESVSLYNSQHGFPSDLRIYVFKIGDEAIFCAERGIYSYDATSNKFVPNDEWNAIFGENTWVKRLVEAPNGDIWYVANDEVGVLEVRDGGVHKKVKKRAFPQLSNKLVGGFEKIYPYDDDNVFFASENGFIHFNPNQQLTDTTFKVLIRKMVLERNSSSIIFGGNDVEKASMPIIDFNDNSLRLHFSATYFSDIEKNKFQYHLEGFEDHWSEWTSNTEKEYTNLNAGIYTFHIRAKNIHGNWSEVDTFKFKIKPPWYASSLALAFYFLIIIAFLLSLILVPRKRFEREKAALQSEQEKTLLEKEREQQRLEQEHLQEISQLEKEKLELQIDSKNQELASTTMHLVQKSEVLQKIKIELQKIAKSSSDEKTAKDIRRVVRKVSADEQLDNDWEQFTKHFDQVHSDFLKRLRETYPQLTPKDHRLCAYLRMNLTTKEIAPLMNISVRGVEIARYRLRKKLEIDGDVNLIELMLQV